MSLAIHIRAACADDFPAIASIYAASVETSAASFETIAPDVEEMRRRWRGVIAAGCPYLVSEAGGAVQGYAYARPFHERAAFAWTVEDAIYVAPGLERRGVGSALLGALIEQTARAGFRQMIALIASDAETTSVPLHAKLGFAISGRIVSVGFKHGRWHDIVYMQRALGRGDAEAPLPVETA